MKAGPTERGFSWWSHYLFDRPKVKTFIFPSSSVKRENERFKVSCPQVACVQTSGPPCLFSWFFSEGLGTSVHRLPTSKQAYHQLTRPQESWLRYPSSALALLTFLTSRKKNNNIYDMQTSYTVQQNKDVKWTQIARESTCKCKYWVDMSFSRY